MFQWPFKPNIGWFFIKKSNIDATPESERLDQDNIASYRTLDNMP